MNVIEEFGNLSGLKLNKNKTEGIWLGRLKHTKDKYENITWTNEPIKSFFTPKILFFPILRGARTGCAPPGAPPLDLPLYSFGIIVQEPINVMLGSISDLNTVILPINEMFLWFRFFIMALHLLICFS
jgi:hypothetical protein